MRGSDFLIDPDCLSGLRLCALLPRHQRGLFGDGLLCGVEVQSALIQAQQLCYPLRSIQVSVLFNHLQAEERRATVLVLDAVNRSVSVEHKRRRPLTLRLTNLSQ